MKESIRYGQVGGKPGAPGEALKGRGAVSNPANRYQPHTSQAEDDGWGSLSAAASEPSARGPQQSARGPQQSARGPQTKVQTIVLKESSRTIISRNRSPDIPFVQSINPYRGCEHGCIYCYARPSHAYWDLSPGLDFETKIIAKPEAAALLRRELARPSYQPSPINLGANTDPYQPLEAKLKITRAIIEVLADFRHPFSVITKSKLVLRDLDLLAPLAEQRLFSAAVSVTTLDRDTKRRLEPRAAAGEERLETIRRLSDAGVNVHLLAAPMIPCINDHEMEDILARGKEAGAKSASYILLRLPLEISEMFQEWLAAHYPERAAKVMSIVRQSRGGKDYQSAFGKRMTGTGQFAELLAQRFRVAARKCGYGKETRYALDCQQFRRPSAQYALL